MSTNGNLLTSPVGEILFMAVNRPVTNSKGNEVYSLRLAFDSKKDAEFISKITAINSSKPVTADTYRGKDKNIKALLATGKTLISAETKYPVLIFDKEGNELDEAPMFFGGESKGTAQMVVQPYTKSTKGGTINLISVYVHNIEGGEGKTVDRETRLAQLRALAKKNAKG